MPDRKKHRPTPPSARPVGSPVKADYDSPWKDILETYFQSALELCFPQIARQVDWSKGVQLLDKEFQKIVRRSELGRRNVDVLAQVWTIAGREQWVLLHVEVQAQRDPDFPRRMFDYYSRICQRYNRPVASLAILADAHPRWQPSAYEQEYNFVDWVMVLSAKLEREVEQEIEAFEETKQMKYITNMERRGLEKGLEKGRQEGQVRNQQESVLAVLETRFGEVPYPLRETVTAMDDLPRLKQWLRLAIQLPSLRSFQTHLHEPSTPAPSDR
jgi:hypothetical protein